MNCDSESPRVPSHTIKAQVIPADWLQRSNDFQARLMRAGLGQEPVIEAAERDAWGAGDGCPTTELLPRLLGDRALGDAVVAALTQDSDGPLSSALRCRTAVRVGPTPDEGIALLALLLARSVRLDVNRTVPFDVLNQIGDQGAALVPLLRNAVARPERASADAVKAALTELENGIPYPERDASLRALTPSPSTQAARPAPAPAVRDGFEARPARASAAASHVSSVDANNLGALKALTFKGLIHPATYGSASAVSLAAKSLGPPPTDLGKLLLAQGARADSATSLMGAVVKTLWSFRDPVGQDAVAWERFASAAGKDGVVLAESLVSAQALGRPSRPNYREAADLVTFLSESMPAQDSMPLIDALVRGNGLLPPSLPTLDKVSRLVPSGTLEGHGLVAAQHLFPSTVCIVDAFLAKGMKAQDIFMVGTPYATNPLVAAYLRSKGVTVMEGRDAGGASRDFEKNRLSELHQFLGRVSQAPRPAKGFVVLDDGGLLATTIGGHRSLDGSGLSLDSLRKTFPPELTSTVEQTTRGLTELSQAPLAYDAVTVANSPGKKREGNIIGWSLASTLLQDLRQMGRIDEVRRIAVVSAGTVGLAAARHLKAAGFEVSVHDNDPVKVAEASREFPASVDLRDHLATTDLVLGCTGKRSLEASLLEGWNGIVAQGSSAAIEVDEAQVEAARNAPLRLVNNGRPLNFKGDGHENLRPDQIDLTQSLLFAGVVQAATMERGPNKALVPLDTKLHDAALTFWDQNGGDSVDRIARNAPPAVRAQAPDATGRGATHSEWMSFLSSQQSAVCPVPSEASFAPGVYFFADSDGTVKWVNTQDTDALGHCMAAAAPLASVPLRVHAVEDRDPHGWLIEAREGDGRTLRDLTRQGGTYGFGSPKAVSGFLESSEARPSAVDYSGQKKRSVVYDAGDSFVFTFAGSTTLHSAPKKVEGEALVLRPDPSVILEIAKAPPTVSFNEVVPGGAFARAYAGYSLPSEFTAIEAFFDLSEDGLKVLVGRTASGQVAVAPFLPGQVGQKCTALPEGAVCRGVHRADPARPWDVTVSYTMPGDAVEFGSMRELVISFG